MQFRDINESIARCRRLPSEHCSRELRHFADLCLQADKRWWFLACWHAAQEARSGRPLAESIVAAETCFERLWPGPVLDRAAEAAVCLDLLREMDAYPAAQTVPTDSFQRIADERHVSAGLVKDQYHELRHTPVCAGTEADPQPEVVPVGATFAGPWRPALHRVVTPVLLLVRKDPGGDESRDDGVVANLILEWVAGGSSEFYPSLAQSRAEMDARFVKAAEVAWGAMKGVWAGDEDIRWQLGLRRDGTIPMRLSGDSLRGALEWGLALLAVEAGLVDAKAPWQGLAELGTTGIAVTAGFGADGGWSTVGGVFEKLREAARASYPSIHTVIVSSAQNLKPFNLSHDDLPQGIWKDPGEQFGIMHILQAKDLDGAITLAKLDALTRWPGFRPRLPELPRVNIPRQGFLERIETFRTGDWDGYLEVVGEMGRGKTTAMAQVIRRWMEQGRVPVCFFIGSEGRNTVEPREIARSLYLQLRVKYAFEEPKSWAANYPEDREGSIELKLAQLLQALSEKLQGSGGVEVLFIEAADQTKGERLGALIPDVLRRLPPRVRCVITTRPLETPWKGAGETETMVQVDIGTLVDDRHDVEQLLRQRSLGVLNEDFIQQIFAEPPIPVMFTVDSYFKLLEEDPSNLDDDQSMLRGKLLSESALWRMEPEALVHDELDRVLASMEARGMIEEAVLERLAVHVLAGRPLNKEELAALGFWDEQTNQVMRRAANFFKGGVAPLGDKTLRFEFAHPGYRREIERRFVGAGALENRMAAACLKAWKNRSSAVNHYALEHGPNHLLRTRRWGKLLELLTDMDYVDARCRLVEAHELARDYQTALAVWPEREEEQRKERERTEHLHEYGEKLARHAEDPRNNPLPPPPPSVELKLLAQAEPLRQEWTPVEQLEAWAHFVANHTAGLGKKVPPIYQLAWNSAAGGPIQVALANKSAPKGLWLEQLNRRAYNPHEIGLRTLEGHTTAVIAVALTADGQRAVSADCSSIVRIGELEQWERARTIEIDAKLDGLHSCVALAADGQIAVALELNKLRIWDLGRGQCLRTLEAGTVTKIAVTADGKWAVSGSPHGALQVWSLGTGRSVRTFGDDAGTVRVLVVTPDGRWAVSGGDDCIRLWDMAIGRCVHTLKGRAQITAVAMTADGLRAASGDRDGTVAVWDLKTGQCMRMFKGHTDAITAVAVTADGRSVASADEDGAVVVWDVKSSACLRIFEGERGSALSMALTADGRRAVCGSGSGTLRVWDLRSGQGPHTLDGHTRGVQCIALSADGRRAVSGSYDHTLRVWNVETSQCVRTLKAQPHGAKALTLTADGRLAVSSGWDGTLQVWNLETGQCLRKFQSNSGDHNSLALSADGRWVVSGNLDHTLRVWNTETGQCVRTLEGHTDTVAEVALADDGRRVVSVGHDRALRVWDLATGECVGTLEGHTGGITSMALTASGLRAVSGSADTTLRLWDLERQECILTLKADRGWVRDLAISADGRCAVSVGGADNTLRLWDLQAGEGEFMAVFGPVPPILCAALSADGSTVAAGTLHGAVCFLAVRTRCRPR